jgi:hypothetical protein
MTIRNDILTESSTLPDEEKQKAKNEVLKNFNSMIERINTSDKKKYNDYID